MTARTGFFFHHPLRPRRDGPPGRVQFDVDCMIASASGRTRRAHVAVAADGYGRNLLGPNQDPCVFASPLAVLHSFCKLDRNGPRYFVDGTRTNLAYAVHPGSVVFYGHLSVTAAKTRALWVDTVVVVERVEHCPAAPVSGSTFHLDVGQPAFAKRLIGRSSLRGTDVYVHNLEDARPGRKHQRTTVNPHLMIVGIGDAGKLGLRRTSFVPLWDSVSSAPVRVLDPSVISRFDALIAAHPKLAGAYKPPVRLPARDVDVLYDAVVAASTFDGQSGWVAIPPLRPLHPQAAGARC